MSDLHEQNRKAIMLGLEEVNGRLSELSQRLSAATRLIGELQADMMQLKQEKMEDLVKKFGSGPTAN